MKRFFVLIMLAFAVSAQQTVNNFAVKTNLTVGNNIQGLTLNGYNIDAIATNSAAGKLDITNGTAVNLTGSVTNISIYGATVIDTGNELQDTVDYGYALTPNGNTPTENDASPRPRSVGTVASLLSDVDPLLVPSYSRISVLGRISIGDGGGGDFQRILSSGASTNLGTSFQSTANATYAWQRVTDSSVFDVRWFGAIGDGITDCTAAIQDAIDTAARYTAFDEGGTNVQGGTVFMPIGIYRVTSTLTVDKAVKIRGEASAMANGPSVGILWGTVVNSELSTGSLFEVTGYGAGGYARSLGFYDLALQGNGSESDGINYNVTSGGYDLTAENLVIRGFGRTGLRFESNGSLAYSTLRNLRVTSNGQDGIYIAQSYGGGNAVGMTLENCYSASNGRYGFALDGMSQVHLVNCVENNSGSHAYYVRGHVNMFEHCFAEDAAGSGVFLWEARNNLFDQFNAARCVSGGSTNGLITLSTNAYNNVFSRSVLDLPSSPTGPHVLFHASSASWNAFRDTTYSETRTVTDNASQNLFSDDFDASLAPTAQARNRTLTGGGNVQFSHGISMTNSARITLQNNQPLQAFDSGGTARQAAVLTSSDIFNFGSGSHRINMLPGTGGLYLGSPGTTASIYVPRTADATSGATTKNSQNFNYDAAYWNGSASTTVTAGIRFTMDSTAPAYSLYWALGGTDRMRLNQNGQLVVGDSTISADSNSALTISSTSRGLMLPRLTTTQRDAMSSPADGILIYNSTTSKAQIRAAGAWVDLH